MHQRLVEAVVRDAMAERVHQILDRAPDRRMSAAFLAVGKFLLEPVEQGFDLVRVALEMGAAFPGCSERLARAFGGDLFLADDLRRRTTQMAANFAEMDAARSVRANVIPELEKALFLHGYKPKI